MAKYKSYYKKSPDKCCAPGCKKLAEIFYSAKNPDTTVAGKGMRWEHREEYLEKKQKEAVRCLVGH